MVYLFSFLISLIKGLSFFTGSYSNTVFLDPLSKEEEEKYINLLEQKDKEARNKLIEHNLRLVAHIVKKFDQGYADQDDLISIGTIGLIKGVDSYNKDKNIKLTTYVAKCIENEILMFYRSSKKYQNTVSLNDSIGYDKDGNKITLIDVLKDDRKSLDDEVYLRENIALVSKYLAKLNKREKEIIVKRYGLNNRKEMTQKDIAKELKISRSYVSRIEKRAISKILKDFIKNKKIQ
ncbi:MAG: RNA polymerase sporulation sigma factor SigK [Bacilli bacterium]|nr:RNA polymerase sporulation sigma factor SigK [Bacilli bacterium]